ncbi:squalene/phytoene synthase family protein [Georgenia sp. EYE_87]|uniref:phytoene/squalene synthase family protein n=1 Tax=Georgenia sp. EYE_87 TaxID=2853448 RepID=UPI002002A8C1|nr:squalene/phytoene synthase family protein [Georgenia sp. EYE_87]MCK6212706.1 squalene/phytoene synthase family protein [Georgenia sp. EYE_87]
MSAPVPARPPHQRRRQVEELAAPSAPPLHLVSADPLYDAVAQRSAAAVIDGYSTSFGWACRLLREPVRTAVRNIYALVRLADEIVDGPVGATDPERAGHLLHELEEETYRTLATGHSTNLVIHAFALTARRAGIGADLVAPFFASMRTDLSVTAHDPTSLDAYVYGSAEVVGLMCLRVFVAAPDGRHLVYEELAPGARRLGAAFQKVNFLRDLADDHDALGRTYFPGLDVDRFTDAHRDHLLDDIDADLAAAAAVATRLPPSSRAAVLAAHGLFAELSARLRTTPAAEIRTRRVRVPAPRKALVLARSLARGAR